MDIQSLVSIFTALQSTDSSVRRQAETEFERNLDSNRDVVTFSIVGLLTQGTPEQRQQASVYLRTIFRPFCTGVDEGVWTNLSEDTKKVITSDIFTILANEPLAWIRSSISDFIFELGSALIPLGVWNSCIPNAIKLFDHQNPEVAANGVNLAADLYSYDPNCMADQSMVEIIKRLIDVNYIGLILACLRLISVIVCCGPQKRIGVYEVFVPILHTMLVNSSARALDGMDDGDFKKITDLVTSIAERRPRFLDSKINEIFLLLLDIVVNNKYTPSVRVASLECLLIYCESRRKFIASNPAILGNLVEALITCITEVEETSAWYSEPLDAAIADDEVAEAGEFGLDRLGCCIDGEVLMPIVFEKVGVLIRTDSWKYQVAAILSICQTIEFLPENMVHMLGDVITLLLEHTNSPHYRVRYGAWHAIAQIGLDHAPNAQLHYWNQILPIVIKAFDDQVGKVQAQALAAFVNFTEEVEPEDFAPFVSTVVEKVNRNLSSNYSIPYHSGMPMKQQEAIITMVREQSITALSVAAGNLGTEFVENYPTVIPLMMEFVSRCNTEETRLVCGRAIECLTIISFCVGKTTMGSATVEICNALANLFTDSAPGSQDMREYLMEAIRRMAKCMGPDFNAFTPRFVPALLNQLDVNYIRQMLNRELEEQENDANAYNTGVSAEVEGTLRVLMYIIDACGAGYVNFFEPTEKCLTNLFSIEVGGDVERITVSAIAELLGVAALAGLPAETTQRLFNLATSTVLDLIQENDEASYLEPDEMSQLIEGIETCISKVAVQHITQDQIANLVTRLMRTMENSTYRRALCEKITAGEVMDEDEIERVQVALSQEDMLRESCLVVVESIMKYAASLFIGRPSEIVIEFAKSYIRHTNEKDHVLALFVCSDMLEHFQGTAISAMKELIEFAFSNCTNDYHALRRVACFIVSLIVRETTLDAPTIINAGSVLLQALQSPDARTSKFLPSTENAVSGLLTILTVHPQVVGSSAIELVNSISSHLPIEGDNVEAIRVHTTLFTSLSNPESIFYQLTDSEKENSLEYMHKYYVAALEVYKNSSDQETDLAIVAFINRIMRNPQFAAAVANLTLTPKQNRGYKKLKKAGFI